ncbi:MAG TPA: glycosyltransferase family 1 protein, partial [Sulfurimonas autotrophica]|nr:glycosyltransferase family 1 protein [Sulfurimonas autotrophica]
IRKNFDNLIKAYGQLSQIIKDTYQLVIVSKVDEGNRINLFNVAKHAGLSKDDLILTGYVSDEELIAFYSACDLFVFVSTHEGFGLPVLEAMNCGAVVIGSNTTSIPEVIGHKEALFDPFSIQSIRDKIEEVLTNSELYNRLKLHNQKQIQKFSWESSAKRVIEAIQNTKSNNTSKIFTTDDIISKIATYIPEKYSENELCNIAKAIHANQEHSKMRQLFLDVSEFSQRDAATGVQRVVKAYLKKLLVNPPKGYEVVPVYATTQKSYKYANKFTANFLAKKETDVVDLPIKWQKGDIFFGLDMQHHVQLANIDFYHQLKNDGVIVKFLIYDLLPIELKKFFKNSDHSELHTELMRLFASLDGVICISKATSVAYEHWMKSANIISLSHFQNNFVHMGVDKKQFCSHLEDLSQEYRLILKKIESKITFLSVSTIEPRKKQDQILAAIEILWQQGYDVNLVFVGKQGWKTEALITKILKHKELNHRLFWLNGIDDNFLDKVYQNATALVAASINEGFGLPLIEAAQHKLSIIARDIPVFKEVAGEYAYYFQAKQAKELAASLMSWIELYKQNNHPKSDNMPYLSWEQSTQQLKETLLNTKTPTKRLFLDISELVTRDAKSGIQRVVRSILIELFKNLPKDFIIEPVYATTQDGYRYAKNFTYKFLGHKINHVEEKYIEYKKGDCFFILDMQPQVQIIHQAFYKQLKYSGINVMFMLYDLLPITMSRYFPIGNELGFVEWLKALTLNTNGSVCISQATADEYKIWCRQNTSENLDNFKITVAHLGADIESSKPSEGLLKNAQTTLKVIQDKISFITVGTIEPRKGHRQILKAFEILWENGIDINLVIVGKQGWLMEDFVEMLRTHPELEKQLFWLEGISDEYLQKVYESSDCLIAASEGEGFGLPLIEAAQYKKPIIARDIPVFREVAGEFAYYFKNDNNAEILEDAVINWLKLYKNDEHPKSDNMPWLTWEESTKQLVDLLEI